MTDINISLLIPGYLSPSRREGHTFGPDATGCPTAMQWSTNEAQVPWQASLFQLLVQKEYPGLCLPAARLLQPDIRSDEFIVRADPVHLQADRDTAKLIPLHMLNLEVSESEALIDALNQFLAVDGFKISMGADQGWYMVGMEASCLESFPPSFLANRNASAFLPSGENSESWRRLMTEIQMLLHTHPVNEHRMQHGKLPINSLWFWGGAKLPVIEADMNSGRTVYADDEFSQSLCAHFNIQCRRLFEFDPATSEEAVVVDTRIASAHFDRNEIALNEATNRVDLEWLAVLSDRVKRGEILQISVSNEDGDAGFVNRQIQQAYDRAGSFWRRGIRKIQGWVSRE